MPHRRLTPDELVKANELLEEIRLRLVTLSGNDRDLLFAYRRKLSKELVYDERSKPMDRRALKKKMAKKQDGLCAVCKNTLPPRYNVLDRFHAPDGYVEANVRLICETCDRKIQAERRYS